MKNTVLGLVKKKNNDRAGKNMEPETLFKPLA